MHYIVTRDFNYHGLEMFAGEELDDHYDYIGDPDTPSIEPDMYGSWLDRGWIVLVDVAVVTDEESEAED